MNLKIIKIIIITILICLTISIVSYIVGHKNFAHYTIDILIAIGTCGAVVQALYLSIPQKENVEGYCQFIPTDVHAPVGLNIESGGLPKVVSIKIKNNGNEIVTLPPILHIDVYANNHEWGCINIPTEDRAYIFPNTEREFKCKFPEDKGLKLIITTDNKHDLNICTYTLKGTLIKLKRVPMVYSEPQPIYLDGAEKIKN